MIADKIEEAFGKLSCTTGKKHKFLGTNIEFIGGKKVSVSIPCHVNEALEDFGETLKEERSKPHNLTTPHYHQ